MKLSDGNDEVSRRSGTQLFKNAASMFEKFPVVHLTVWLNLDVSKGETGRLILIEVKHKGTWLWKYGNTFVSQACNNRF